MRRSTGSVWQLRSLLLVIAAGALAGSLGACERPKPAAFPHNAHLETRACDEPGLPPCPSCQSCHESIVRSEKTPWAGPSSCERCHKPITDKVKAAAAPTTAAGQRRSIVFSHKTHMDIEEFGGQCVPCHRGVTTDGAQGQVFPEKAACLDCHEMDLEQGRCTMCHLDPGVMRQIPRTFVRHDESFVSDHSAMATRRAQVCNQCHTQANCSSCHDATQGMPIEARRPDAIDRNFVHRADFVSRHAIEARFAPARCLRCHQVSSCDGCHIQRNVSGALPGSANPHPWGWLGSDPNAASFHGKVARRDITSCAACHDHGPATNCIGCHRQGGRGGSPHPAGWRSTRSQSSPMCRYCHAN